MAILVGKKESGNYGEDYFVSRAIDYLDDSYVIYRNRQIYGKEYDVCILLPNKGLLVVELKGWREDTILRVENDAIVINTDDGEAFSSPQKQARGYRFSIQRYIKNSLALNPLVFQMVCLPQVTRKYYFEKRLDIVSEEKFTILKEDLETNAAFFKKLDGALKEVSYWYRDPFDDQAMRAVRNLFEPDYEPVQASPDPTQAMDLNHAYDYSRFYYFKSGDPFFYDVLGDMIEQFKRGCKLYCVFGDGQQLADAVAAIDVLLQSQGLVRNRFDIEMNFDGSRAHFPPASDLEESFSCFNCSFSTLKGNAEKIDSSFYIVNGIINVQQHDTLMLIGKYSDFNVEQYLIEHAAPEKNIVIKAGAGTGKTYTMISRIGYVCYSQNVPLSRMADRITMITFTNEAADSMEEKLKNYYRNCYLLTSRIEYLDMISLIDHMQISTIHSYAKHIITKLGTEFGYGIDLSITSSEFNRRQKVSEYLDAYINKQNQLYGNYTSKLGIPVYVIRDLVLDFTAKLNNKSISISDLSCESFGLVTDAAHKELHQLLAEVIPCIDREFNVELLNNNLIHLSSMMSVLHRLICSDEKSDRISELKNNEAPQQFMFVDEFQDTDDAQIEVLLELATALNYKLFLVGDIKQCIYRFRGAKEKSFDHLNMGDHPADWLSFSLQRNYRTDSDLLDVFHKSFESWGARDDELLSYSSDKDRLIGTQFFNSYNPSLKHHKDKYYHCTTIQNDRDRIKELVNEIKRIQARIAYEESHGQKLKPSEKSIAILVRENWQADLIRRECKKKYGIDIQTSTGGDLFATQPALDMLTLVNALLHFDEAEYLYNLATSNFFGLDLPKASFYELRSNIKRSWKTKEHGKANEMDIVNNIIDYLNVSLARIDGRDGKWEYVVRWLRSKPVLQVLRDLYDYLQPWKNYNPDNVDAQRYYQINVDLIFEHLINSCNIDRLTINTLQEHLYSSIVSQVSVDSRTPQESEASEIIQCITVHKSKGLEYGHVILPYCNFQIGKTKKAKLSVSTEKKDGQYQIGYRVDVDGLDTFQNNYYSEAVERAERSREETRILYVAMTRAIRSFSWIEIANNTELNWQNLIVKEG